MNGELIGVALIAFGVGMALGMSVAEHIGRQWESLFWRQHELNKEMLELNGRMLAELEGDYDEADYWKPSEN